MPKNFPFARDRRVELYFWILAVYFEPKYSLARISLTQVINIVSIVDDIYDTYGFLDELVLFTDSIERYILIAILKFLPTSNFSYDDLSTYKYN